MKGTLRCKLHFCLYVCFFFFFCNKDLADWIVIEYLGFPSLKLSVKIRDGSILALMKKSGFLTRNHWSLTSTYQLKTGFDFCLRIKASTFIISYDLPPPFFPIDVFRDKVLSLGFSRSVSLVQCVWLPANLRGVGLSFS